jgi:RNA polymerase sigma-70 factor (ECF subfamily)
MSTQLIDRARQGDMEAFAELFEELRPMVHAIACRLVGSSDAEDVVMETFLKAWKAVPRFQGSSSLNTWVYRITHNCAQDFLRARSRRDARLAPVEKDATPLDNVPDPHQVSPADSLVNAELGRMIDIALARLSPEHAATLQLRFVDGLSYSELAAATGVSLGTVMSRLFNGRRKLCRIMSELEDASASPPPPSLIEPPAPDHPRNTSSMGLNAFESLCRLLHPQPLIGGLFA